MEPSPQEASCSAWNEPPPPNTTERLELLLHTPYPSRVPVLLKILLGDNGCWVCRPLGVSRPRIASLFSFLVYNQADWSTCLSHTTSVASSRWAARCCRATTSNHFSHVNIAAHLRNRTDYEHDSNLLYMHSDMWLDAEHAYGLPFLRSPQVIWSLHSSGDTRYTKLENCSSGWSEWPQPSKCTRTRPGMCSLRRAHPFINGHWGEITACATALQQEPEALRRLEASVAAGAIDATCCYGWMELLHLPARVHTRFIELEQTFRNVFHEFALTVMLFILDLDHKERRAGGAPWQTLPCFGGNVDRVPFSEARTHICAHKIDLRETEEW